MFKLNQPIIKNKVLTWSRDLTVGVLIRLIYGYYCKRHFAECTYQLIYDKGILKSMTSFAGWNFLGNGAYMLNIQGVNILMNMYFGVSVNAAPSVAEHVDNLA